MQRKNSNRLVFIMLLTCGAFFLSNAQSVTVTVVMKPPYASYLSEYADLSNKVIITVKNNFARPLNLVLHGQLKMTSDYFLMTTDTYRPSLPLALAANELKVITVDPQQLSFLKRSVLVSLLQPAVWQQVQETGLLPEANWQLCVFAREYNNGTIQGEGCAYFNINRANAPVITSPANGMNILPVQPTIAFSWTPPIGNLTGAQLVYDLYVVKVMPGQNANDAINGAVAYKANNPLIKTNLVANQYVTQPFDLKLDAGFTYGVQVVARDLNKQAAFQNNGRSEVITFTIDSTKVVANNNPPIGKPALVHGKPSRVNFKPNLTRSNLNLNTFKGRLTWAFRKTEHGIVSQTQQVNNSGNVSFQQNNFSQPPGNGNKNIPIYGGGSTSQVFIINTPIEPKDQQKEKQEKILSLTDAKHYPLANTEVNLELFMDPAMYNQLKNAFPGTIDDAGKNTSPLKPYINLGKVKTDAQGNFSLHYHGELLKGYELQLTVHSPYFEFAEYGIKIQTDTNGVYDIGEMTGMAKTFRLKVKVTDQDGVKLDAAKVEIKRQAGYYTKSEATQNLWPEVMREELANTFPDLAGKGKAGETFTRLFASPNYYDSYFIKVYLDSGPQKTYHFTMGGNLANYVEEGVLFIEKNFKILMPDPIVKGRVLSKNGNIPLKDALIQIAPDDPNMGLLELLGKSRFATTDDAGRFEVINIPASTQPYNLWVAYKGKSQKDSKPLHLTQRGMIEERDPLLVDATMLTVCGTVKDKQGQPIAFAQLHWKEGGEIFTSDEQGKFNSAQSAGKHTVIVQRGGFRDLQQEVTVTVNSGNCNLGLVMQRFYVQVTVKDAANSKPIPNAIVQPEGSDKTAVTNANGVAVAEDVSSGTPYIIVKGPATSLYATIKTPVTIDNSKDTISIEVLLKAGSKVNGKVSSKGAAVQGAEVYVVGKEYITAQTDGAGNYVLPGVPDGEYTLRASKPGLLSDDTTNSFQTNQSYTLNFNLTDPGFNASSIYGFSLTLTKSAPGSNANEFIISGELTNLPDNTVFKKLDPSLKIGFTDVTVVKTGNTIVAKAGVIKTDIPEIELLAFNFAKVRLKSTDALKVVPLAGDNNKGEITGEALIDVAGTFTSLSGWKLPAPYLNLLNGTNAAVGAITSTGTANITLKLNGPVNGMEVYSVKLKPDWANSFINTAGLTLKGAIDLSNIPLLNGAIIQLDKMQIDPSGKVKEVALLLNPQPQLSLLSWKLKVNSAGLNAYGLAFGGDMDVPIPSSANAKIGFANLLINETGIKGGDFYFPTAGIDVFGFVKFKAPPGTLFALQKIPGSQHYQLTGGGTFTLPSLISQSLELSYFNIRTDGNFGAAAKTGISVGFANMASLAITNVSFNTALKEVTVGGKFYLNIPGFGLGAQGNIHYKNNAVTVDKLGIKFNLSSAVAFEANVDFKNGNEFSGDGSLKLGGLTDAMGASFFYKKLSSGISVGASFKPGVVIPIGIVKLDQLSGGFSLNTSQNKYKVFADGRITFAPDPAGIVALNPVHVEITSTSQGPSLFGSADVKLMDAWTIGNASLTIDYPKKYFSIDGTMGGGFNLLKGISVEAKQGAHLELSAQSGNAYWFFSYYTNTHIANFINANVSIAGGWGISKTQHSSLASMPDDALHSDGKLYGGYFTAYTHIGGNSDAMGVEGLADVTAWFNNDADATVYANVKAAKYGFHLKQNWSAGGEADFFDFPVAGADVGISGELNGIYDNGAWGVSADLDATVNAWFGCHNSCNTLNFLCGEVCPCLGGCCITACAPLPCGVKICASGSVHIGYSSSGGFSFKLNL